jgi:hypothetical protein
MIVTGQEITNITLTANTETKIQYDGLQQLADIMNLGPGTVYVSWRKTAVVGDANCLVLPEGSSYELRPTSGWFALSIIGSQASAVQVVTK